MRSHDPESYAGGSLLLVGPSMSDRSKVMIQTKRDSLVLQVGCWAWGKQHHTVKKKLIDKKVEKRKKLDRLNFCDGKFVIHMVTFLISS